MITIEPGLYYPGIGGVRIEDTVLVEKKGLQAAFQPVQKFEI